MEKNTAIFQIRNALDLKQRQMITFLEVEQSNYSLIEAGKGRKMTVMPHFKGAKSPAIFE